MDGKKFFKIKFWSEFKFVISYFKKYEYIHI